MNSTPSDTTTTSAVRASRVPGAGGIELAVFERGDPSAPTIVLVHGYPDTSAVWTPVADRLASTFHVVTYDVRGAGASEAPESTHDYDLRNLVDDLRAVVVATSPDRAVHVVGHDWGSIQAWEAVVALEPDGGLRSGLIRSFTSVSGPSLDHVAWWVRNHASADPRGWPAAIQQASRSWYVALFRVPIVAPLAWRAGLARAWPRMLAMTEGVDTDDRWPAPTLADDAARGVALYRANIGPRRHPREQLRTAVPVQLIVPRDDPAVTPALLDGIERLAPTLCRRDVPGGHWIMRRDPDGFVSWVTEFVEQVEAGEP